MVKLSIFPSYPLGGPRNRAPLRDIKHLMINDSASDAQGSKVLAREEWWEKYGGKARAVWVLATTYIQGEKIISWNCSFWLTFPTTSHSFQPSKLTFWNMDASWFPVKGGRDGYTCLADGIKVGSGISGNRWYSKNSLKEILQSK